MVKVCNSITWAWTNRCSPSPSTPVYEKTQEMQVGMYEVKPALESLQRHQIPQPRQLQHHQHQQYQQQEDQMQAQYHQVYDREMSAPGQQQQQQSGPAMVLSASSPWSTQQQAPAESQAFWNPGGEHKFPSGY
ncbi:hypothetical protein NLJ89_g1643 [Agrocybe chaxingu]|uniref:Uncharacterized protein n=1 Tax=Agrocybe chaxingu TaxID=84603 RepID=A0A9W8MZN0_9AGAR|nr:hypothetical protein NLJ89_g1643 [Agrocybe chaxingu]